MAPTYRRDMPQYTGEMLQNIPQGVLDVAQGIYDQVTNPLQTAQGIYERAAHPLDTAGALYGHYANRYKNLPVALDTLRKDPVGVVADLSPLALMRRGARLPPLEGEVLPPARRGSGPAPRAAGPTIEGRAFGPGVEDFAPRNGPAGGPGMSPPMNGFDRAAMDAYYRNTGRGQYGPYTPGARSGFAYKPEHMRRTSDMLQPEPGYVDLEVVKNDHEFYDPWMMDHLAERMRAGDRSLMRHELYGPNAGRPPYGEAGTGPSPFELMANPGVKPRTQMPEPFVPGMRAPYGQGSEGKGYFGELPNPGVRGGVRPDMRGGLPVAPGGNAGVMPGGGGVPVGVGGRAPMSLPGENGATPRLSAPQQSGGTNLVPTEIPGEFYEVRGLGGPQSAGPVAGGMPNAAGRGMPYGRAAAMAIPAIAALYGRNSTPLAGDVSNGLIDPYGFSGLEFNGGARPGMADLYPVGPSTQQQKAQGGSAKAGRTPGKKVLPQINVKTRDVPLPPRRPDMEQGQGWSPNLNYIVTQMIDRLVGQNEAERGRAFQQYYDQYR